MREIKFRAWNKNKNKMVHPTGAYGNMKFWHIESGNSGYWGIFGSGSKRICGNADDSGILMQYTGLKDKNGVEIYEGDILRFTHERKEEGFVNTNAKVEVEIPKIYYMITNPYNHNFKIIGNIYENPELLEV